MDLSPGIQTLDGKPCVFPFVYKGETYFDCTTEDDKDNKQWCSTTTNYDQDRSKGYCATKLSGIPPTSQIHSAPKPRLLIDEPKIDSTGIE